MPGTKKKSQPKKKRNQDTASITATAAEEACHSGPESAEDLEAAEEDLPELTVEFKSAPSQHPGLALLEHYGVFGVQSGSWSGPYIPKPELPSSIPTGPPLSLHRIYEDKDEAAPASRRQRAKKEKQPARQVKNEDEVLSESRDAKTAPEQIAGLDCPPAAKRIRVAGHFTAPAAEEPPALVKEGTAESTEPAGAIDNESVKTASPVDSKVAALTRDSLKISKKLREIAALEGRAAEGAELEKLQLEKLQKKATLEHELRTIKIALAMLASQAFNADSPHNAQESPLLETSTSHYASQPIEEPTIGQAEPEIQPPVGHQEFDEEDDEDEDDSSWVSPDVHAPIGFYEEEPSGMHFAQFGSYQEEAEPQVVAHQEGKIGYHPSLGVVFDSNLLKQINEAEQEAGEDDFSTQTYSNTYGAYDCANYGALPANHWGPPEPSLKYVYDFQARAWVLNVEEAPAPYAW